LIITEFSNLPSVIRCAENAAGPEARGPVQLFHSYDEHSDVRHKAQLASNLYVTRVREVTLPNTYVGGKRELAVDTPPFVGRVTELAQLTDLLVRARLVTVMGTGGVGKTTLAFRATESVAPQFADGVCVTPLSALSDGKLLPHTVVARLGLSGQSTRTPMETLLDYLRDREMLLVLDTCEHLIDACAELTEALLEQTCRVTVLATSRQPLDVNGENLYPLSPLSVPAADGPSFPGDATDLFTRRAVSAAGDFAVTAENRGDVVMICERLDGIPLAIELAAVRLRTLSLSELVRLLTDRLAISEGQRDGTDRLPATRDPRTGTGTGTRTTARLSLEDRNQADTRHRTLQATIGWSYDLCTPAEQALWERLSVFAGSFGIDAAKEVCAGRNLPRDSVAETVVSLVDKSVLVHEEPAADDADGRSRYRFLDTIREFGAERLAASGAKTGVQDRLIGRYAAKAKYFGDHLLDDDQLERYRELAREHASIRAALEYTLETKDCGRAREGAEMAADLYGYWAISGRLREGSYWLGKVLERFPGRRRERARALVAWSYLTAFQGEPDKSVTDAREGIAIAAELGDDLVQARGYMYMHLALAFSGQYTDAVAAGTEAERRFEALGDRIGLICLDTQMAHMYQLSGNFEAAARYYERGLHRFGDTREKYATGYLYGVAGMSLFQQPGREAECAAAAGRALLAKHELNDLLGMGLALQVFAWLASRAGRHERCAWLLGAGDEVWERAGGRLGDSETVERICQQSARATRDALGDQHFEAVYQEGWHYPRDGIVKLAVTDADSLPPVLTAR
jgi:non-specific serine/threonine protein kinase